jgi:hypothetical protein
VVENLVCFECGSEYRMIENSPRSGSGFFRCHVCGETIFCWQGDRTDYNFELTQRRPKKGPGDAIVELLTQDLDQVVSALPEHLKEPEKAESEATDTEGNEATPPQR